MREGTWFPVRCPVGGVGNDVVPTPGNPVCVRPAVRLDQPQIVELAAEVLVTAADDAAVVVGAEDLTDIQEAYFGDEDASCFWIAHQVQDKEGGEKVLGMVGAKHAGGHGAAIRRLAVHPDYRQKGIGSALVQQALRFCSDRGYVKLSLDTDQNQQAATKLFQRFGFSLSRRKETEHGERLEFYLDLYSDL